MADFERWQGQTADAGAGSVDADGVLLVHGRNAAPAAAATAGGLVTLFYAPWCHYSQLMLPKFGGAGRLLGGWAERGLLPAGRAALAKVNVDEEGDLRGLYNGPRP